MDNNGTPLKNRNVSINRRIITGFNDAFIITREQKEQIISKDSKSAEIIRPLIDTISSSLRHFLTSKMHVSIWLDKASTMSPICLFAVINQGLKNCFVVST